MRWRPRLGADGVGISNHGERAAYLPFMTHDAGRLLLDFVAERDVPCPACGYNLRDLTAPGGGGAVCPECGERLVLYVGREPPRFALLIAALTPCMFSGIAALFLMIPIGASFIFGNGGTPLLILAIDAFGLASGATGIILTVKRERFIRMRRGTQAVWAVALWGVHVAALCIVILLIP